MSAIVQSTSSVACKRIPELRAGDHLTRPEFERRYLAMPHVKKAELVEGIVYMPSPVRVTHAMPNDNIISWVVYYLAQTPGILSGAHSTVRLDCDNELQPDELLLIPAHAGGQARVDEDDYVAGAPELVAEISGSTVSFDLHTKLNVYRRNGVREYIVWRVDDDAIDCFQLREGQFVVQQPQDGICKSECFPGLWLDVSAIRRGDLQAVFAAVDRGIAGSDHAAFAARVKPAS